MAAGPPAVTPFLGERLASINAVRGESMKTPLPTALALALLAGLSPAQAAVQAWSMSQEGLLVQAGHTDRLIVKYKSGKGAFPTENARLAAQIAANRHGVQLVHLRQMASGAQVFRISRRMARGDIEALAASFRNGDANIEYVEPDRLLQPQLTPNDPLYAQQWSLFDAVGGIRAPDAWNKASGDGVTVAVIDTGVRPHADFAAKLLPGYDFIANTSTAGDGGGRDGDASDPGDFVAAGACGSGSTARNSSWHGTHVSGIIGALGSNGLGVSGVAFKARLLPVRALGKCGGYTSDIADAMIWAAGGSVGSVPVNANPARVINLSLGGAGACDITTQNAINSARARGAVVVVAAGNSNQDAAGFSPANCSGVITVAATGKTGGKAFYSNYGSKVTLAAPGGDSNGAILSTYNTGSTTPGTDSYAGMMGTSMATPVVSGVVALMLQANKNLTPDQVASLLKSSARAFPAACTGCGAGLVDANAAVNAALAAAGAPSPAPSPAPAPAPTPAPTPSPTPTPSPAPAAIKEAEPNDSLASAQWISASSAAISGSISSNADNDYYRYSIPAGKTLKVTLSAGSASGFGLGAYTANGTQLVLSKGVLGATQMLQISNTGGSAVTIVLRVLRSTGATGGYGLSLGI